MLSRRRQLAAKIESSEGVAETLAAADAKLLVYDSKVSFDPEMYRRNPVRSSMSSIAQLVGKRSGSLSFRLEMRGSGTAITEPEWSKLLKASGFACNSVRSFTIGAVTNGPFLHGETVAGGTSLATGRVIINTATGASAILIVVLTGTFQSGEVLTGNISGATATTSSTGTVVSKAWELDSSTSVPSLTIGSYEDGVRKLLRGCRGHVKFGFKSGEPGMMDFDFRGVEAGVADTALLSGIAHESTVPPIFLNAAFTIDAYAAKVGELDLDIATTLASRDDINNDRGILSYIIANRQITGSYNPEMVLAATHDFHTKWFGGTEMVLDFIVGTTTGNKFRIYAPKVQYTAVADEDRDSLAIAKSNFELNSHLSLGDTELCIIQL
ncbi:MAG: hypothetical protein HZB36_02470 [Candidatus Omnitrophica bacterium]|nr:hypothetical protein [Candidatus Omnitrophota bacterium]